MSKNIFGGVIEVFKVDLYSYTIFTHKDNKNGLYKLAELD